MSIPITETFEWVPLYFKNLMKSLVNNYIHTAGIRAVSGQREERVDLMIRTISSLDTQQEQITQPVTLKMDLDKL